MSALHTEVLCYVLAVAGPMFFMFMQLSFLQTASKILTKRSDCKLSPLPFVSLVTNCIVMTMYGYLRSNATIFIPNLSGLIVGIVCTIAYQTFTEETKKGIYLVSGLIIIWATYFFLNNAASPLGMIGVGLSVILMGSPLATLRTVIVEKSTNSLPFATSITTFLNALSWSLYGVIEVNDPIVYTPNLIGLFLATIQLSLFIIYGFPSELPEETKYTVVYTTKTMEVDSNLKKSLITNEMKNIPSYV